MRKYIVILLLMILVVIVGIHQVQSQAEIKLETKNKNVEVIDKEIIICDNEIEQESDSNIKTENENYMIMEATAYTKSIEEGTHRGITKSGTQVSRGTVAIDPRVIPLGTKVYVEGYGHAECLDIGGAIKGNKIDLYMDSREECFEFGRRDVKVYIIE